MCGGRERETAWRSTSVLDMAVELSGLFRSSPVTTEDSRADDCSWCVEHLSTYRWSPAWLPDPQNCNQIRRLLLVGPPFCFQSPHSAVFPLWGCWARASPSVPTSSLSRCSASASLCSLRRERPSLAQLLSPVFFFLSSLNASGPYEIWLLNSAVSGLPRSC